ncbi:MAG: peptidase C11, partial [Firmicutes bacterium]|nr:peptidase C11 [Candidatus Colimorpha enterica]
NSDSYKEISDARSGSREFSPSSKIDQVDLVDLATRMDTKEGKALAETILSAVKYNRASSSMTNSYGLSIYFPYRRVSTVDSAVREYDAIGLDDEYAECIKSFAGLETAGQVAAGGTSSALPSLLGTLSSFTGGSSSSAISSLLNGFIGGSSDIDISGLASTGLSFLSGLNVGKASDFVAANRLDASDFIFKKSDGQNVISLPDEKWALVHDIELNVFVDDGEGFIDLGLDNVFSYTERGELLAEYDGTWLALNGQAVAYYHVSTFDDGTNYTIKGRVPVLYNGERSDITVSFDNANPKGYVSGVTFAYAGGETDTVAKTSDLAVGAEIEFLCDYYTYAGEYQDSYRIGDKITYDGTLTVSDVYVDGTLSATYRITDIYGQHFWTSVMG